MIFETISDDSLSYIFISHDLQAVSYLADSITVMHKGKLIEQATSTEELTHPQSKKLLEASLPAFLKEML